MPHPTPECAASPTSGEALLLERRKESCQAKDLLDQARQAFDAGHNRHAADLATQAATEARRQHLPGLEVPAGLMLLECALNDGDLRAAVQHGLSAWTLADASADGSLQCRSRLALARVSFPVGDYSQALADLESA